MFKLYNTLSQKKEIIKPRTAKKINIFVCGPTTYDFSHLGHARTYIVFDMVAKYLKEKGYKVYYLQNITDVDDKIIERAKKKKIFWKDLSKKFEREYLKDMKALHINSVAKYARATEHIKEIISQVERLLKKGYAYQIGDGIYYDISRFKDYGKLSKKTALMAEDAVSRIDEAKEKRNKGDFCLWKFSRPNSATLAFGSGYAKAPIRIIVVDGKPAWLSPWGWGRPGWHIEDTAITEKYFGPQYDIHGGARDLIFPHHEAEIAQMEAISGKKPLVKYWLHTGFLTVKGTKMSKSLRNFITIRDFLKSNPADVLRMLVLSSHYRSPLDFSKKAASQAKKNLAKLNEFPPGKVDISKAMDDDFNTPLALAAIFKAKKWTPELTTIFGFTRRKIEKIKVPEKIKKLVQERQQARQKQHWQKADEIRKEVEKMGYAILDTKKGAKVKKNS